MNESETRAFPFPLFLSVMLAYLDRRPFSVCSRARLSYCCFNLQLAKHIFTKIAHLEGHSNAGKRVSFTREGAVENKYLSMCRKLPLKVGIEGRSMPFLAASPYAFARGHYTKRDSSINS